MMGFMTYRNVGITVFVIAAAASLSSCTDYLDLTAPSHDCAKHANVQIKTSSGTFAISGPCETILVSGNGNKLTVTGAKAVEVRGDNNTVLVEATDDIAIRNGSRNTVTYKKGLTGSGPNCVIQGSINNVCERQRS
jgi:hypothetical protein